MRCKHPYLSSRVRWVAQPGSDKATVQVQIDCADCNTPFGFHSPEVTPDHITLKAVAEPFTIGAPRLCPGCRSVDGEHDFGPTCFLEET